MKYINNRLFKKNNKKSHCHLLYYGALQAETTIAKTVSKQFYTEEFELSAVLSGVKDLKLFSKS